MAKIVVNGQENGVIAFKGDTEPCAVYIDGVRQDNVSYTPELIEGENSVEYKSEYKKNIRTMQIEGNSTQPPVLTETKVDVPYFQEPQFTTIYGVSSETPISIPQNPCTVSMPNFNGIYLNGALKSNVSVVISYEPLDMQDPYTAAGIAHLYDAVSGTLYEQEVTQNFYIGLLEETWEESLYGDLLSMWNYLQDNANLTLSFAATTPTPTTPVPIHNTNDSGMSLELMGKNLFDINNALIGSNWVYNGGSISYPIGLTVGKQYTFSTNTLVASSSGDYNYALVRKAVIENWGYSSLISLNRSVGKKTYTFIADGTECLWIYRGSLAGSIAIQNIINSVLLEKTESLQIEQGSTATEYEPYFNTTIAIPPSVTVGGENVDLRMSIYDKIIVDRLNGKVTYSSGTWYKEFNGNETFYQSTFAENNGYGRYYIFSFDISATGGYCSHFKRSGWLGSKTVTNVFSWVEVNSTYNRIAFKTDGNKDDTFANSLEEFKALLKSLYDTGTPVTVLAKLKTSVEYDITNTDLGQALLDLANSTQNATNIITITSTPSVSKLSVNYAKWGGAK